MGRLFVFALLLPGLAGCSSSDDAAPDARQSADATMQQSSHPAAEAAHAFLSAVIEGDTTAAANRLTPRAIEQFRSTGKRFAPPGLESATFRIGEVRVPSASQALVQCVLTNKDAEGGGESEEMCCIMRLVSGDWRVSGIAYDVGGTEPIILDFEKFDPQPPANPQQFVERPEPQGTPRTAQRPGVQNPGAH